jgi:hypothetical protein
MLQDNQTISGLQPHAVTESAWRGNQSTQRNKLRSRKGNENLD